MGYLTFPNNLQNMTKTIFAFALLIAVSACTTKQLTTDGLKSKVEEKTGVTFAYREKTDSAATLVYIVQDKDTAKGFGRFDSAKSACISYFNNPGTCQILMDKAFFKWNRDGFYTVLFSELDKDSNLVFNIITSKQVILADDMHQGTGEQAPPGHQNR
jgi:hypothetical protein